MHLIPDASMGYYDKIKSATCPLLARSNWPIVSFDKRLYIQSYLY
jgi:hypothetical protein